MNPSAAQKPTTITPTVPRPLATWLARAWDILFAAAVVSTGVALARTLLGVNFAEYDDEGYALISLARYLKDGRLYNEVYSQYGPFFFLAGEFCFRILGVPLNHDGGRLLTFLAWMASSLLGGWTVYRSTRQLPLGAAACGSLFVVGRVLANEPMHPQFLVLIISVLAVYLSFSLQQNWTVFTLGVLGVALLLTKINVGTFFLLALLLTLIILFPECKLRTIGLSIAVCLVSVLPYLLMRARLNGPYCLVAGVCIFSVAITGTILHTSVRWPVYRLLLCLAGGALTAALVVGLTLARGSSLTDLANGLVLWPARLPALFTLPLRPPLWVLIIPITSALLCRLVMGGSIDRFRDELGALCLLAGLITDVLVLNNRLVVAMGLLPLGFIPIVYNRLNSSEVFGRLFLMNWCVLGFLQAYPVAGSQVGIAGAPLVIWGFICAGDGLEGSCRWLRRAHLTPAGLARAVAIVLPLATMPFWPNIRWAWESYPYPASRLDGANSVHLSPAQEMPYWYLAENVKLNCDLLFTLPGMFSFNFWSGVPPPNGWNLTAWMKGFDLEQQQKILEILRARPRSCVIENSALVHFWQVDEVQVRTLPLGRYILDEMPPVFVTPNGYVIRMHPRRNTPWTLVTPWNTRWIPAKSSY